LLAAPAQASFFAAKHTIQLSELFSRKVFGNGRSHKDNRKAIARLPHLESFYCYGFSFGTSLGATSAGASAIFGAEIFCLSSTPKSM